MYLVLAASLVFYASWGLQWVPLLVAVVLTHCVIALLVDTLAGKTQKNLLILFMLSVDVALLVGFKADVFRVGESGALPLGISFYIFQCMGYLIDVYRKEQSAIKNPVRLLTSVSYFPHLPAGPLLSTADLSQQFSHFRSPDKKTIDWAFYLFLLGLTKKTLADMLGVLVSNNSDVQFASSWISSLSFYAQLYGDFSGYTDMACGLSLLLGIQLPLNFRLPFFASSPEKYYSEHWHVSLGQWIKKYFFLPVALLAARRGWGTVLPFIFTMGIMGLWHGLAWGYLAWGLYVAIIIVVWNRFADSLPTHDSLPKWVSILFTNYLVLIGLVFFRQKDLASAWNTILSLHSPASVVGRDSMELLLAVGGTLIMVLLSLCDVYGEKWREKRKWSVYGLMIIFAFVGFAFGKPTTSFIYFNF